MPTTNSNSPGGAAHCPAKVNCGERYTPVGRRGSVKVDAPSSAVLFQIQPHVFTASPLRGLRDGRQPQTWRLDCWAAIHRDGSWPRPSESHLAMVQSRRFSLARKRCCANMFYAQSLPPVFVSNKEVGFPGFFIRNSSIDVLHGLREAEGLVDVLGVSVQHFLSLNGPVLITCQSKKKKKKKDGNTFPGRQKTASQLQRPGRT